MIGNIFHFLVYQPLYNGLVFLIDIIPGHNVGLAVIFLTIIVRLILYPLSKRAILTQVKLQEIQPQIDEINKKFKDSRDERAKKTLELYRSKKISPLAPLLPLFIQLPIIGALYYIFARAGIPSINTDLLYAFVGSPEHVATNFFDLFDVTKTNLWVALTAGVTQFVQASIYRHLTERKGGVSAAKGTFSGDFQRSMNIQMQYVLPIFVGFIAYKFAAVIALYWTTTNLFSIMQELTTRLPHARRSANKISQ